MLLFYLKPKKVPVRLSSGASPPMSSQVSSHVNLLHSVQVHKHCLLASKQFHSTNTTNNATDSLVLQFHCTMFQSHSSLPEKILLLLQLLLLLLLDYLKKDFLIHTKLFLHITKCLHFKFFSLFPLVTLCFLAFMAGCWGMIFHHCFRTIVKMTHWKSDKWK